MLAGIRGPRRLAEAHGLSMCNLYSITKNQDAIRRLFKTQRDSTGDLPPMPGVLALVSWAP
jgi:hypothetical protein